MSGNRCLKLLARDVRNDTLQFLRAATPAVLTCAPAGTSNHILWHAGHALWLQDLMCVTPLSGASELPEGWAEHFGMNSQPQMVFTWPTRDDVQRLLQSQLERMLDLLDSVTDSDLAGAALGLGRNRSLCGWIVHGLHDEAKHSGEMYLLLKMAASAG